MKFSEKFHCLFKGHTWEKYGGPRNAGGGRFSQAYICSVCKKTWTKVS